MNALQRSGLVAAGVAFASVLVMHNPSAGYTTTVTRYEAWPLPSAEAAQSALSCAPPSDEQRAALTSQRHFLGEEIGHCRRVALDFPEWRSDGALLRYFATVKKVLAFAAAILLGGLSWLWLFRAPRPRESSRGQRMSRARTGNDALL